MMYRSTATRDMEAVTELAAILSSLHSRALGETRSSAENMAARPMPVTHIIAMASLSLTIYLTTSTGIFERFTILEATPPRSSS
jgi:hypothetical protein